MSLKLFIKDSYKEFLTEGQLTAESEKLNKVFNDYTENVKQKSTAIPVQDYIIISPDNDRNIITLKGADGNPVSLYIPKEEVIEQKALNSISGEIVSFPLVLSRPFKNYIRDLRVGDKIYFHFNAIENAKDCGFVHEGCYGIHLPLVYCAVRDGEIIPVGNTCFINPVDQDVSEQKTESGIILPEANPYNPGKKNIEGEIMVLPRTYHGELKVGDRVLYDKDSDVLIEIEGMKFYRMQVDDIIAKI